MDPLSPWVVIALAALLFYVLRTPSRVAPRRELAVVISGCDTGFGHGVATSLAAAGFSVFAGCLTPAGVASWAGVTGVHAFLLDVRDSASVAAAATRVTAWVREMKGRALHALVNNAGIGASGLIDWETLATYRTVMEVNYLGHVDMTKAFTDLLFASASASPSAAPRVINITSIAGILGAPGLSAYCASKFALEAFSDCLRREWSTWGVAVTILEPSFLATPILHGLETKARAQWNALPPHVRERYGEQYFQARVRQGAGIARGAESPTLAIDAIVSAVLNRTPPPRVRVGTAGRFILPYIAALPASLADPLIKAFAGRNAAVLPAAILQARSGAGKGAAVAGASDPVEPPSKHRSTSSKRR